MIRFCQKEDCDKQTIKRGKYCIDHCTIRKKRNENLFDIKTDDEILEEIRNKRRYDDENRIFQQNKIIEDRLIMEEQNREYNETYNRDLEIKKQKDENERKEIHDKQKFTNEMNEKIHSNSHRENDEYYKIKFVFPNLSGLSIISTFSKDDYFKNIFDFCISAFCQIDIRFHFTKWINDSSFAVAFNVICAMCQTVGINLFYFHANKI